ncbi:MAG TPA: hypothetical protein DCX95_04190 [Elusimicrobia bacterium]|nr:hypothetical protein [Elusimicrobiota bacterium]
MKLHDLQEKLAQLKYFTPFDIKMFAKLTDGSIRKIIWRYTKKGIFVKLRNNLYMFKNNEKPSLWRLANRIYGPSYISFETALSYYGIIPETVYAITSATSKITRNFIVLDNEFAYKKIKIEAFTGYRAVKIDNETVLVAEPEKALADYLYFVHLKKSSLNERLRTKKISKSVFYTYIKIFHNESFSKWVHSVNVI